jgi:hypothetical protein
MTEQLQIFAIYVGLNGLILLWLMTEVGLVRASVKVSIGDGGNFELIRVMRGQANFVETVPYCLLILLVMALMGAPVWVIHLFALPLTVGRILHGLHFAGRGPALFRGIGAGLTMLVLLVGSIGVILHAVL